LVQVIGTSRFIEVFDVQFCGFCPNSALQEQPADGNYGGHEDKAEKPFLVYAVLTGA
jgi:hypothetical protein